MKKAGNFPANDGPEPIGQPENFYGQNTTSLLCCQAIADTKSLVALSSPHKLYIPHHIHEILKGIGTVHGLLVEHHEVRKLSPGSSFPCLAQF